MVDMFSLYQTIRVAIWLAMAPIAIFLLLSEYVFPYSTKRAAIIEAVAGVLGLLIMMPSASICILATDAAAPVTDRVLHCAAACLGIFLSVLCVVNAKERIPLDLEKELSPRKARRYARQYLRNSRKGY